MKKDIFLEENEENIKEYTVDYYNEMLEDIVQFAEAFEIELSENSKKLGLNSAHSKINHRESTERRLKPKFSLKNRTSHELKIPGSSENIEPFLRNFIRQKKEIVRLLVLNDENKVIDVIEFNKGTSEATNVTLRDIIQSLLNKNVKRFVYIHNHPKIIVASFTGPDANFEFILNSVCKLLNIEFVDSFVITDWDFISRKQLDGTAPLEVTTNREWMDTLSGIKIDNKMSKEIEKNYILFDALIGNINMEIERE